MTTICTHRQPRTYIFTDRISILFFVMLAYLSYSIPIIYSYLESVNFIYVNAWDEETYLSYQGALGAMKIPGYWTSGTIIYLLHNIGITGAEINLLFDCLLTPIMFCALSWSLKSCGNSTNSALSFSVILLFSPILFNLGNPLLSDVFSREYGIFGFGFEPYQSILRTPEPQLSYFLISLAAAYYIKTKKTKALIAILPFLYFFVAIVYAYFLIALLAYNLPAILRNKPTFLRVAAACLISYIAISTGFVIFDHLFLSKNEFLIASKNLYIESHTPMVPLAGLLTAALLAIQTITSKTLKTKDNHCNQLQFAITLSIFLISNIHIISGVMLSYKNYMDYAVGFMGGMGIVIFLRFWLINKMHGARLIGSIFALIILSLTFNAYGFNPKTFEYNFFRGLQFTSADYYKFVSKHPMSIIIPDSDLSAKIPYSVAKMPIPIFSYQYNFPLVAKGCGTVLGKMVEAIEFLKAHDPATYENKKSYFMHSIEVFSGQHLAPLGLENKTELSSFCKQFKMNESFQVLKQDFKDNGWLKIKILH